MNELLERILRFIPSYLGNLLEVVRSPKQFIRKHLSHPEHQFENALVFLGISFVIGWLLKLSMDRKDPWIELLIGAGFVLMVVLGYGAAVLVAWRTVRGRADIQKIFMIHFYYSGVLILFTSCWFMASMGVLKASSPQFYSDMMDSVNRGNLGFFFDTGRADELLQAWTFQLVFLAGMAAIIVWCIAAWGAYRELNRVSVLRSVVAALVSVIISIPVTGVFFAFAGFAVSDGSSSSKSLVTYPSPRSGCPYIYREQPTATAFGTVTKSRWSAVHPLHRHCLVRVPCDL